MQRWKSRTSNIGLAFVDAPKREQCFGEPSNIVSFSVKTIEYMFAKRSAAFLFDVRLRECSAPKLSETLVRRRNQGAVVDYL
ncbi:hypothetical protein GCM10023156_27380 [Novipirellula rosea]|uniref:Uncharacterized protein n=1 Tax=Novipirellula rosea TaxID=1031540 RepID=A0ABP8MRB1_9BACT